MVSVIITTYKREPFYLERAIESVLAQTYKDWELIVVDDSPSDYQYRPDVKKLVEDYSKKYHKITYIQQPVNGGACKARNTGLKAANGEYVGFFDDDDEWTYDKLSKQVMALNKSDDMTALVYCNYYQLDDDTNNKKLISLPQHKGYVFNELLEQNFIGSCSFPLLKTSCVRKLNGFDEKLLSCQDWDMWLRIAHKYKVCYINDPLIVYHAFHGANISGNANNKVKGYECIFRKYNSYITQKRKLYWRHLIRLAPMYGWNKQYKKAVITWLKAVKLCPWKIDENVLSLVGRAIRQIYRKILS